MHTMQCQEEFWKNFKNFFERSVEAGLALYYMLKKGVGVVAQQGKEWFGSSGANMAPAEAVLREASLDCIIYGQS